MKRFISLFAISAVGAAAAVTLLVSAPGASGASASAAMPTINLAMTGKTITVSGQMTSGAVNIVSTLTGAKQAEPTLLYLKPGVTFQQAFAAGTSHNGDPNYLDPYGSIVFDANATPGTSTAQTVLAPGNYVALDTEANNPHKWPYTEFTVTSNPAPAALPPAQATITAIEFNFRGPSVLHDGALTRFQNGGFLVHMVVAAKAKTRRAAQEIVRLLRAGKDTKAQHQSIGAAFFAGPLSSGALQQFTLNASPGWYVLACFMDTQDGREHTQLGMERIVKIVK
jgi:hypothetical protein